MRYSITALVLPCALLLSACTTVTPAFKDIGSRSGPCVEGGPDTVGQAFYDYRIQHRDATLASLRPYLSDDLYSVLTAAERDPQKRALLQKDPFTGTVTIPDSAEVASASTIPNTDARNIPLRVKLQQGSQSWQDEVLMIREGQCWAVDDIRYLSGNSHALTGTLRQTMEER